MISTGNESSGNSEERGLVAQGNWNISLDIVEVRSEGLECQTKEYRPYSGTNRSPWRDCTALVNEYPSPLKLVPWKCICICVFISKRMYPECIHP